MTIFSSSRQIENKKKRNISITHCSVQLASVHTEYSINLVQINMNVNRIKIEPIDNPTKTSLRKKRKEKQKQTVYFLFLFIQLEYLFVKNVKFDSVILIH